VEISSSESHCLTYYKAITRFDRWSLSVIGMLQQLPTPPTVNSGI
jgi:hypothetical protein